MPIPAAWFECKYERIYNLVTSLRPIISVPPVISARRTILPTISLCKKPSCPAKCEDDFFLSGGAAYTVGQLIHVTMSLDSGSLVTGIQDVVLSCVSDETAPYFAEIVRGGCAVKSVGLPTDIRSSFSSHVVCVSFQTPKPYLCHEFYIHARLQSCSTSSLQACPQSKGVTYCTSSRRRRSTESFSVGPILVLDTSKPGVSRIEMDFSGWDGGLGENVNNYNKGPGATGADGPGLPDGESDGAGKLAGDNSVLIALCAATAVFLLVFILYLYFRSRAGFSSVASS